MLAIYTIFTNKIISFECRLLWSCHHNNRISWSSYMTAHTTYNLAYTTTLEISPKRTICHCNKPVFKTTCLIRALLPGKMVVLVIISPSVVLSTPIWPPIYHFIKLCIYICSFLYPYLAIFGHICPELPICTIFILHSYSSIETAPFRAIGILFMEILYFK